MGESSYLHPELERVIQRHKEFFSGTRNYLFKVTLNGFDRSSWPMNNNSKEVVGKSLLSVYEEMKEKFVEEVPYAGLDWERDFQKYYQSAVENRRIAASYRLDFGLGDDNIPAYFPYFGNAIHHAFFGGQLSFQGETSYCTSVIQEAAEYEKLSFDTENIWMQRLCEGMDWCREHGEGVLLASLRGVNGPLDMANGVMGNSLFTEVIDDEENMKRVMKICTEACDAMCRMQKEHASCVKGGYISAMGNLWMPEPMYGQLSVDAAMMAGPRIYEKFEKPYIERLAEIYQGFLVHSHLMGWKMHDKLAQTKGSAIIRPSEDPNRPTLTEIMPSLLEQAPNKVFMVEIKKETIENLIPCFKGRRAIFELKAQDIEDAKNQLEKIHTILGE